MGNKKFLKIFLQGIAVIAVFAAAFYFADIARENGTAREIVADYGYLGAFVVAVVSGFNLAIPIPAIAFLPLFLESGLNYWTTIGVITLGTAFADMAAFYIGRVGRQVFSHYYEGKIVARLDTLRRKYRWAPLALLFVFASVVPLPNEILVVPMGFLGYRLLYAVPIAVAGNFIFNTLYSIGVINLFEFL